jgi:NAD(P)-dependent dehydrogenase (short-subunit alcohol dehydrogenase family)
MTSEPQTNQNLHDQVAVITGGGRGIGRVIAQRLASAGVPVAILARSKDQLDEAESEIEASGGRVLAFAADVTDEARILDAAAEVEHTLGPITLLVNNAGSSRASGPLWTGDPDEWWRDVEINLRGPYICSRAVLPSMIARQQGRIINISSNAGIYPNPYVTAYSCSKAALLRLTDSLAASVQALGIQVFAISPGWVWTEMTERAVEKMKQMIPNFQGIPDSDICPPEMAAELVLRLARGEGDQLTGRYIHVKDDLDSMISNAEQIIASGLYTLRLNA